jgi:hypothetical protein
LEVSLELFAGSAGLESEDDDDSLFESFDSDPAPERLLP